MWSHVKHGEQMICSHFLSGLCPLPSTTPLNLTGWFSKPKPDPLPAPKKASGRRLKVLHISDLHIDPRAASLFPGVTERWHR